MPITVTTPRQGDTVGPGFSVQAGTDLPSLPVGAKWRVSVNLNAPPVNLTLGGSEQPTHNTTIYPNVFIQENGTLVPQWYPQPAQKAVGEEYVMTVSLLDATNIAIEASTPIGVVWKPDPAGVAWVQSLARGQVAGGFTDADRVMLTQTNQATLASFPNPLTGIDELVAIGRFFQQPPMDLLALQDAELLLTGRGSLARPAGGTQVEAYGARVRFVQVPLGFGKRVGVVDEYELRVIQAVVVGRHGNTNTYVADVHDINYGGAYWRWPAPFPRRIDYDVTPGCVVGWQWLGWGFQG